ncbi:MAG TPA: class I SAM-dependent methyltransferase [Acidimicrobiia bacterium]|nr:class I SAM-dependent methyltransferase [Acidimicrobiia bacterium]
MTELAGVARVTFVPVFPDGAVAVIRARGGFALPSGEVQPLDTGLLDTALRVLLETAGFRRQTAYEFARHGTHAFAWAEGDEYHGRRPHVVVPLQVGEPDALARLVRSSGQAAIADLLEEATRSYRAIDRVAFAAGHRAELERLYLAAATAEGGSGFGGTREQWRAAREPITDAIDHDGTFLDLGCANGLLMESVRQWCGERGVVIEPYGVDIAAGLVEHARERLPDWADRIWQGDAATWVHPDGRRFDYVHTLLDCADRERRGDLLDHVIRDVARPGGTLLVSHYARSTTHDRSAAQQLRALGYTPVGESRPGLHDPYSPPTTAWVDVP